MIDTPGHHGHCLGSGPPSTVDVMHVSVRGATAADAPRMTEVARAAKASHGYPAAWLRAWEPELTITPAIIDVTHAFVAEVDGRVVGTCLLEPAGDDATLEHLWIGPEHQGHRLGRLLVRHVLQEAMRLGCQRVRVASDPLAETFYMHLGGRRVGAVPAPMPGAPDRILPVLQWDEPALRSFQAS